MGCSDDEDVEWGIVDRSYSTTRYQLNPGGPSLFFFSCRPRLYDSMAMYWDLSSRSNEATAESHELQLQQYKCGAASNLKDHKKVNPVGDRDEEAYHHMTIDEKPIQTKRKTHPKSRTGATSSPNKP